jgi:glucarate dehydratase
LLVTIYAITALESARLSMLGRHLALPVAALRGEGLQHDRVKMLGYLSFIGDRTKTDLPCEPDAKDDWLHLILSTPPGPGYHASDLSLVLHVMPLAV